MWEMPGVTTPPTGQSTIVSLGGATDRCQWQREGGSDSLNARRIRAASGGEG